MTTAPATAAVPDEPAELLRAEFDPRVKKYWLWKPCIALALTVFLLPFAVLYYLIGSLFVGRYLDRMSCVLTERSLEIKKGLLNRVESTVPLEKITDLQMFQGPIMRYLGIHGFKVETAGQSVTAGSSLVYMVGIVDTPGFRRAVLKQRDRRARRDESGDGDNAPSSSPRTQAATSDDAVLRDIRDSLARVEQLLRERRP